MEYNVYCDESCHLVSNDSQYMLIGAVYCPKYKVKKANEYIEHLKENYNLSNKIELKWNKIDKKKLDHKKYNQTENEFYHKAYYNMLKYIIIPGNSYNIYPDIKDTNSYYYHQVMLDYLRIKMSDTNKKTIKKVQPIRSYEAPILQINDILIGALSYYYRNLSGNSVKLNIINEIKKLYQNDFDTSSYYSNTKFNIFIWRSRDDID